MPRFILGPLLLAALCCAALPAAPARAHPHAFVECELFAVFDEAGLAGFRQRWTLDEMLTVQVMQLVDTDLDFELSPAEAKAVQSESFVHIAEHEYFTQVRVNDRPVPMTGATDFAASMDENKLVYEFFVPCPVAAGREATEVRVAVYDRTFYTFVTLVPPGGGGTADPTKDPMFGTGSGPRPGDFQRFKSRVEVESFSGEVPLEGALEGVTVTAEAEMLPSMAYFYDQITPDGYVIRFRRK